ncbi:MAG: hypothetical protein KKF50_01710 [Nanoarchaeota archaeon]|nr:hypothetical protein [Nanoarchaeota archaeon]
MKFDEHLSLSIKRIEREKAKFYENNTKTLIEMLKELHHWFDEFADGKTTDHRKIRHHQEGVEEISQELTKRYGTDYRDIISHEAERHVRTDTYGIIPKKRDYEDPFFFQKLEQNNSSSWI